mmetsp:Transcript_32786/g.50051  ORF Transcript_32786/g.50051 Transcript_32786/m.50051 type:complete len:87 (+) Transcript_32786:2475-2735(+)
MQAMLLVLLQMAKYQPQFLSWPGFLLFCRLDLSSVVSPEDVFLEEEGSAGPAGLALLGYDLFVVSHLFKIVEAFLDYIITVAAEQE